MVQPDGEPLVVAYNTAVVRAVRAIDRENMRADRSRLQGILSRGVAGTPQLARDRYEELTRNLGL